MPEKIKHPSSSKKSAGQRNTERRRYLFAFISILVGILMMLSILSYSPSDETVLEHLSFVDVFRLPFNDDVKALAGELHNTLGLFGALTANFFVLGTIGYASLFIPLLIILWAWIIVRKHEIGKIITFTNYVIIGGLLVATTFGLLNMLIVHVGSQWSGLVGAFLADIMVRLLGRVGAPIVAFTALFITVIPQSISTSIKQSSVLNTGELRYRECCDGLPKARDYRNLMRIRYGYIRLKKGSLLRSRSIQLKQINPENRVKFLMKRRKSTEPENKT